MVIIRPPVWISIWLTFIGTFVFLWGRKVHAVEVLACYGTDYTCAFFSMQCPNDHRINVERLQYGLTVGADMSCQNDTRLNCTDEKNKCCDKGSDKCIVDFPEDEAEWVRTNCSDKPSCGPIRAYRTQFNTPDKCIGKSSDYVIVSYSCGPGTDTTVQLTSTTNGLSSSGNKSSSSGTDTTVQLTSTTNGLSSSGNKSSSSGGYEDGNNLPTIIGVVIAAISVIVVVVVALILFRRKIQDKALKTSSTEQISPTRCTVANNVLESINPNPENYASLDKCELGNAEYDQLTHDYINTIDAGVEGGHIVPNYANIPSASAPDIHKVAESTNRTKTAIL